MPAVLEKFGIELAVMEKQKGGTILPCNVSWCWFWLLLCEEGTNGRLFGLKPAPEAPDVLLLATLELCNGRSCKNFKARYIRSGSLYPVWLV